MEQVIGNYEKIYDKYFKKDSYFSNFIFIPHAHYNYCGFATYVALKHVDWNKIRKVIMLSTNHYVNNNYYNFDDKSVFKKEHSWDFVMEVLEKFIKKDKVNIYLCGKYDETLSKKILKEYNENVLVICNSDLSHVNGRFTTKADSYQEIKYNDFKSLNGILEKSGDFHETSCGKIASQQFISILNLINPNLVGRLVCYYNSCQENLIKNINDGKISNIEDFFKNDFDQLKTAVGYGSIIFVNRTDKINELFVPYEEYYLTNYSYCVMEDYVKKQKCSKKDIYLKIDGLNFEKGIFITINVLDDDKYKLRGCIGTLSNHKIRTGISLYTCYSALRDTRFTPINYKTLTKNRFENYISLLDSKRKVSETEYKNEFQVGLDGIEIQSNDKSAFFLPSVSKDMQKEGKSNELIKDELIQMLCRKAGIKDCVNLHYYIYNGYQLRHFDNKIF